MTEADLLDRCRKGDREAQRSVYDRTCQRIFRLLIGMTRNPDDAFDLSQDTYVRAFQRIGQFQGESSLSTWLYRIAVNEALQLLRRKRPAELGIHVEPVDPKSVDGSYKTADARLDLEAALQKISDDDRAILLLKYQEGLDYRAIAQVLDCPAGTVASRLNRARHAMREILGPGYESMEESTLSTHPISGRHPIE
ncbi:MAG: sigma-70 family RNA polymerase sigma factor [Planctomycetes bacterium]|nr:sigma-70 family RNA polymerase sigma factor [Planctomycetota bacterium]